MDGLDSGTSIFRGSYTRWAAIAGFFDGDGCVEVNPRVYTIHWVVSFSDNWLEQIEQVRDFLIKHGIKVGKTRRNGIGGWTCRVIEIASLKAMARKMLQSGGIYKKKRELKLLLDYYSNKVSGTEVLEGFNSEVRLGIRTGKIRIAVMPHTYTEGFARARHSFRLNQRVLNEEESRRLADEYRSGWVTGKSLARKFGVSRATVSRILKRMGVNGRGE